MWSLVVFSHMSKLSVSQYKLFIIYEVCSVLDVKNLCLFFSCFFFYLAVVMGEDIIPVTTPSSVNIYVTYADVHVCVQRFLSCV